jgi:hypothetical protein
VIKLPSLSEPTTIISEMDQLIDGPITINLGKTLIIMATIPGHHQENGNPLDLLPDLSLVIPVDRKAISLPDVQTKAKGLNGNL